MSRSATRVPPSVSPATVATCVWGVRGFGVGFAVGDLGFRVDASVVQGGALETRVQVRCKCSLRAYGLQGSGCDTSECKECGLAITILAFRGRSTASVSLLLFVPGHT
jgi:hypothetical protein